MLTPVRRLTKTHYTIENDEGHYNIHTQLTPVRRGVMICTRGKA
jgi:hypothetical protein